MSRLDPSQLDCGFNPADELRAQAKDQLGDLERVLSWLLETPDQPLSIIGCPAKDRIALLWGLMEIGAPILESQGVRRAWTFSTYETDHGDAIQHLPETVFLPARPVGTSVARRTSVDLTRGGPASPPAASRACELLEQYVHGRPAPVEPAPVEPAPAPQPVQQPAFAPAVSTPSAPGPADHPDLAEMVRSLMAAQNSEDFHSRLATIEHHASRRAGPARITRAHDAGPGGTTEEIQTPHRHRWLDSVVAVVLCFRAVRGQLDHRLAPSCTADIRNAESDSGRSARCKGYQNDRRLGSRDYADKRNTETETV